MTKLKALKFDNTHRVDAILYTRNNLNQFDETTGKMTNNIKPACTDELDERYWMVAIHNGIRHYTTNTPMDFNSLELVNRKMFAYTIVLNHGETIRDDLSKVKVRGTRNTLK